MKEELLFTISNQTSQLIISHSNATGSFFFCAPHDFSFSRGPSNTSSRDAQEIYPVNDIAFHPTHTGLLATTGSDGKYTFWDKVTFYVFLASENFI
jgi:hypothetical protein